MTPASMLLALSDIARALGVGASAVSNWRKRHPEFPEPADLNDRGKELFELDAINGWLTATGREPIAPESLAALTMQAATRAAGRSPLVVLGAWLAGAVLRYRLQYFTDDKRYIDVSVAELSDVTDPAGLLDEWREAAGLADDVYREIFDQLLWAAVELPGLLMGIDGADVDRISEIAWGTVERFSTAAPEFATSDAICEIVRELAPHPVRSAFDPAIGTGELILAALHRYDEELPAVYGQDIDNVARSIAALRLIARDADGRNVQSGDAFTADAFPGLLADLVVCDPPWGKSITDAAGAFDPARIPPRIRTGRDPYGAWLEHCLAHLGPGGTAIVVLPAGSMWQGGSAADVRRSLVAAGAVEAVIALPGLASGTNLPLAIWLLRTPTEDQLQRPVLLVDVAHDHFVTKGASGQKVFDPAGRALIARHVNDFRRLGEEAEVSPGVAAVVPAHRLLADSVANLTPKHWIRPAVADVDDIAWEMDERVAEIEAALRRLRAERPSRPLVEGPAHDEEPLRPTIDELQRGGALDIMRGGRPINKEDYVDDGVTVLTPALILGRSRGASPERFVSTDVAARRPLTEPGDVAVITAGRGVVAIVLDFGGAVVGPGVEVLRLKAKWLDPKIVAGLLSMSSITRPATTGTAMQRLRLGEVALPVVPQDVQDIIRSHVQRLDKMREAAQKVVDASTQLEDLLMEAAAANYELREAERMKGKN